MLTASTLLVALLVSAVHGAPEPMATLAPSRQEVARALEARASGDGSTPLPLTAYTYAYNQIPYKVNPYSYLRGPQSGYNICNSTTEIPDGQCQTALLNTIDSFCLWGAPGTSGNETIGDIEAAVVSYCTRAGLGGRIMPPGTISGLQYMKTSAYIQVVGFLNQTGLGLLEADTGGELDPHGADLLGNPLGGLVYSNQFSSAGSNSSSNTSYGQVVQWNNFIGSGQFCFKMCFPNVTSPDYCQNKFDLIGCSYNMPSNVSRGEFVSCEGELQDEAGIYTGADGAITTWSQPSSLPPTSTLPWTPRVPASSNCVTHASTDLFPLASLGYQGAAASSSSALASSASASSSAASASAAGSSSRSGTSSRASATTTAASSSSTSGSSTKSGAGVNQVAQASGVFAGLLSLLAAFVM